MNITPRPAEGIVIEKEDGERLFIELNGKQTMYRLEQASNQDVESYLEVSRARTV